MTGNRGESMVHVGMNRVAMKTAVMARLNIGQKYLLVSQREEKKEMVRCKLTALTKNFAVFKHTDGAKETFTYQDVWRMLTDGEIK